jgi:AsmA-like C-terminal region
MPGYWRQCRTTFRWARYCVWLLIVLALLALAWANVVGIPDFLQKKIAVAMRAHGVPVEFSRMRWRLIHGLVAENVIVGDKSLRENSALLTAGQIQLRLDYGALWQRKIQLSGVVLRDGILTLPVTPTNRLEFLNLQSEVRFQADETWSLDELRADFSGAKFLIAAKIAHAPDAMNWELFAGKKTGGHGTVANSLKDFADTLAKIKFSSPPQINVQIDGDARDVHSFTLQLNAAAPEVRTPWFAAQKLQIAANLSVPEMDATNFDNALDFWTNAVPFKLAWTTRAAELEFTNFSGSALECAGEWRAPKLSIQKISTQLGNGKLDAAAALDIASRELLFTNTAAFDPRLLKPLLPSSAAAWLEEFKWERPPLLAFEGAVILPAWTNRAPDWREMFGDTARLHGEFAATNATFRGKSFEAVNSHFVFSDSIWHAPDFDLQQGGTKISGAGEFSLATKNFRGAVRGTLDTATVEMFLPTNAAEAAATYFRPQNPVVLDLNVAGCGLDFGALSARGRVATTNFCVREQVYDSGVANVNFTNRAIVFSRLEVLRAGGAQILTADAVALDFAARMMFFTNGFSTTEPMAVIRGIGPKTAHVIEPYEFLSPPVARVNGQLPLRDMNRGHDFDGTDMTFDIVGGAPFRWTKISTTNITGTVHWLGQYLILTNVNAAFYDGKAKGRAFFDFGPEGYGCDFNFAVEATNVDVKKLSFDLSDGKTNLIEGVLSGRTEVADAKLGTWRSWNGNGQLELRDGLLWSVPIFGRLSQPLNAISPGLGNNRATDAAAHFTLTNGVAHTDSMVIHTRTMQLDYVGTVDLGGTVNAHVTAQLLKNMPVVGSLVSLVLMPVGKIFECQVTGQISNPQMTPVFIPFSKYLLSPLRSLQELMPADQPHG